MYASGVPSQLTFSIGILGIFGFFALSAAGHFLFKSGHKNAECKAHSGKKRISF
jgi:hypothetical protein